MSAEHRNYTRIPVPQGQGEAMLRIGRKTIAVRVVNTSATGFSLECPPLKVNRGDVHTLLTPAGWSEIRVAFIETSDHQTKLGVERIRDLEDGINGGIFSWLGFGPAPRSVGTSLGNVGVALGMLMAIVMGAIVLSAVWRDAQQTRSTESLRRSAANMDRRVREAVTSVASAVTTRLQSSSTAPSIRPVSNSPPPVGSMFTAWKSGIPREVALELRLTAAQERSIQEILASTEPTPDSWVTTQNRISQILTAEQRQILEAAARPQASPL